MKLGDIVRFNDNGLNQCFGGALGLSHMKSLKMRITFISNKSITSPEKTYPVKVDNVELNKFMLDDKCFDLVRGK